MNSLMRWAGFQEREFNSNGIMIHTKTFNEFLQTLSHNKRKKIKQERNKIKRNEIIIKRKHADDISIDDIDFFYECYCETYRLHHSTPYLTKSFFYELLKNYAR